MTCLKCNALVNGGWTCCGYCGAAVRRNTMEPLSVPRPAQSETSNEHHACPLCEARQSNGARFCVSCGVLLSRKAVGTGSQVAAGYMERNCGKTCWNLSADIRTDERASRAARRAAGACFIRAAILVGVGLLVRATLGPTRDAGLYIIAEGGLYLVLGMGIRQMSRFCAVAALLLGSLDWGASTVQNPVAMKAATIIALIFVPFLALGVNGVFRHWQFRREQASGVMSGMGTVSAPALP